MANTVFLVIHGERHEASDVESIHRKLESARRYAGAVADKWGLLPTDRPQMWTNTGECESYVDYVTVKAMTLWD